MLKLGVKMSQNAGAPPNYAFATENVVSSDTCENGILNSEPVDAGVNFDRLENGTATLPAERGHKRKCFLSHDCYLIWIFCIISATTMGLVAVVLLV